MGIMMVLAFYAVALTIAASIAALVLGAISRYLTKDAPKRMKRATVASISFPFVCVAFAGTWFVLYALVNYAVFHRDPGLGDTWETPLPNGYALMMIDTTDQGTVYNPMTQGGGDSVVSRDDAVFGVRQLQISKDLIFGARDTDYFQRIGQGSDPVDAYFELNTTKKTHKEFRSLEQLRQAAANDGVKLQLREFALVFRDYRNTWFDYIAVLILVLTPLVGFLVLARWVWRIRVAGRTSGEVLG